MPPVPNDTCLTKIYQALTWRKIIARMRGMSLSWKSTDRCQVHILMIGMRDGRRTRQLKRSCSWNYPHAKHRQPADAKCPVWMINDVRPGGQWVKPE